ncbi:hypothetical protein AMECASPLE_026217 [Ameca splendens]|uniref:Uncharacterized protein n=1 Tax=Ameca splendens TaxID=208324 RepID=A0ABV0Y5C5_9TELE
MPPHPAVFQAGDGSGHAGGTTSLGWPGSTLGSPRRSWRRERDVWASLLSLCPSDLVPDKEEDNEFEFILGRNIILIAETLPMSDKRTVLYCGRSSSNNLNNGV